MANEIVPEAIGDDEWLSQYGTIHKPIAGKPFKCCPTFGQTDISMMRGRRTVDEMARSVNRKRSDGAVPGEGVRRVLAGRLRDAGLLVHHTPRPLNPAHVSVLRLDGSGEWTEDDKRRFEACFEAADDCDWKEGRLERSH